MLVVFTFWSDSVKQEKIGNFIAELRRKNNLTQAELGEQVGVTGKAVSRWERGLSIPDVAIINKVSEVLGITTTELLNGEKLGKVNTNNIDEITENSIDFYKEKLKKKFRKILFALFLVILILCLGILLLFYFNNYNTCRFYSISPASEEIKAVGILNITSKKDTLIISDFHYFGTGITDVYAVEYKLKQDDKVYFQNGNIKDYEFDSSSKKININDYFNDLTIYIEDSDKSMNLECIEEGDLLIEFNYIGYNGEIYNYSISLVTKKEFSNSKILY